jgi:hypothetical protein
MIDIEALICKRLFMENKARKRYGDIYLKYIHPSYFIESESRETIKTLKAFYKEFSTTPSIEELEHYWKTNNLISFPKSQDFLTKLKSLDWSEYKQAMFINNLSKWAFTTYDLKAQEYADKTDNDSLTTFFDLKNKAVEIATSIRKGELEDDVFFEDLYNMGTKRDIQTQGTSIEGFNYFKPYMPMIAAGTSITIAGFAKSFKTLFMIHLGVELFKLGHNVLYVQADTNTKLRSMSTPFMNITDTDSESFYHLDAKTLNKIANDHLNEISFAHGNFFKIVSTEKKLPLILTKLKKEIDSHDNKKLTVIITDQSKNMISSEKLRQPNLEDYKNTAFVYRELHDFAEEYNCMHLDAAHLTKENSDKPDKVFDVEKEISVNHGRAINDATNAIFVLYGDEKDITAGTRRLVCSMVRDGIPSKNKFDCNFLQFDPQYYRFNQLSTSDYMKLTGRDLNNNDSPTADNSGAAAQLKAKIQNRNKYH